MIIGNEDEWKKTQEQQTTQWTEQVKRDVERRG
jgi:hypothetical protein